MSDLWATPQALFDKLNKEFFFELDVCALPENAKCAKFFTPEQDGLNQIWPAPSCHRASIWMNPPYGREIERWIKKAYEKSKAGVRIVALIPNRSNAPWWHEYVMKAKEIRFVKHKVAFDVPNPEQDKGVPFWGIRDRGIRTGRSTRLSKSKYLSATETRSMNSQSLPPREGKLSDEEKGWLPKVLHRASLEMIVIRWIQDEATDEQLRELRDKIQKGRQQR